MLLASKEIAIHLFRDVRPSLRCAAAWFFADQVPRGDAMTLEYSAVAPADSRTFQLKTHVTLADGTRTPSIGSMRTMMPIVRERR